MISKQEIENAAELYSINEYGIPIDWTPVETTEVKRHKETIEIFTEGTNFAIEKIENIAIDFAEYVSAYYSHRMTLDDEVYYRDKSKHINISPSDLFKQFLNERIK